MRTDMPICFDCLSELIKNSMARHRLCPRCGALLRKGGKCPVCARDRTGSISKTFAPFRYQGAVRALVIALKFHGELRAAPLLVPYMVRSLGAYRPDVVCAVPLSRRRFQERGYNQAEVLARLICWKIQSPYAEALVRVRNTRRQSEQETPAERKANVLKAFDILDGKAIAGKRVLLVDDVRTSGSTAIACAEILKKYGASEVCLAVAAIAPGNGKKFVLRTKKK